MKKIFGFTNKSNNSNRKKIICTTFLIMYPQLNALKKEQKNKKKNVVKKNVLFKIHRQFKNDNITVPNNTIENILKLISTKEILYSKTINEEYNNNNNKIITSNKKNLINPGYKKNIQIGNLFKKIN